MSKYVSKINHLVGTYFQENLMFGTKHSKINQNQKTIEYKKKNKINKQSTKYIRI